MCTHLFCRPPTDSSLADLAAFKHYFDMLEQTVNTACLIASPTVKRRELSQGESGKLDHETESPLIGPARQSPLCRCTDVGIGKKSLFTYCNNQVSSKRKKDNDAHLSIKIVVNGCVYNKFRKDLSIKSKSKKKNLLNTIQIHLVIPFNYYKMLPTVKPMLTLNNIT